MGGAAVSGAGRPDPAKAARFHVAVGGRALRVEVDGDAVRLESAGAEGRLLEGGGGRSLTLSMGDRPHRVFGVRVGETSWEIHHLGRTFRVEAVDERSWRMRRARSDGTSPAAGLKPLRAPMPGLVLRVDVEEGQEVAEGQGLLIVEAMKMENELRARAAGRVRGVHVAAGESVGRGDILIEFEQDVGQDGARDGAVHSPDDSGGGPEP